MYLAEKTGQLLGQQEDCGEFLFWISFISSGIGPFSSQAVHFQFAAPEGLDNAVNRYRREAARPYQVLNEHLAGRGFIVGDSFTTVDISAWRWIDRAPRVFNGTKDHVESFPEIKRWFAAVDARPAVLRARGYLEATISRSSTMTKRSNRPSRQTILHNNHNKTSPSIVLSN